MAESALAIPTVRNTIGNCTYQLPFADMFPPMKDHEFADLRASMAKLDRHGVPIGIINSVVTYDSAQWGDRCVIDGMNRLYAAEQLGILVTPKHRGPLSDDRARLQCLYANLCRRELTREEKAGIRAERNLQIVEDREGGESLRTIAARYKVNPATVLRILRAAGVAYATPDHIVGADEKPYPARRPAEPPTPETLVEATRRNFGKTLARLHEVVPADWLPQLDSALARHDVAGCQERTLQALAAALADLGAGAAVGFGREAI